MFNVQSSMFISKYLKKLITLLNSFSGCPSSNCLEKISDVDSNASDTSDNTFAITTDLSAIAVSPTTLTYGACGQSQTGYQVFSVSNIGGGTLKWTAASDREWLTCTPTAGTNSGKVTVTVDPTGLAPDDYDGCIKISDPNAVNSPGFVFVFLKVYAPGKTTGPIGSLDTPKHNATVYGSIAVTGWVLDDLEVKSVEIHRLVDKKENSVY